MTDVSDSFTPSELAAGDRGLELIEEAGTELTPEFVTAFNNMSDADRTIWVENARRNLLTSEFGWAATFLDDPELGPLLRRAVGPPRWSTDKLRREIEKTNWWKTRSDSQRAWDQQAAVKPGETTKRVEAQSIGIRQIVSQYGGTLSDEQVAELATRSLRDGWNTTQVLQAVAAELVKGTDASGGVRFGITGRSVRDTARRFGVPLSDMAADEWATKIATGQVFQDDFENWARTQAKGLYPSLSAEIDRGLDVATITDPYRQIVSSTLGISPETVNFADPKWNAALNFDDGKGRRMMTLYEWGRHLRTNEEYGYDRTPNAVNKAYQITDRLGKMFGVTA